MFLKPINSLFSGRLFFLLLKQTPWSNPISDNQLRIGRVVREAYGSSRIHRGQVRISPVTVTLKHMPLNQTNPMKKKITRKMSWLELFLFIQLKSLKANGFIVRSQEPQNWEGVNIMSPKHKLMYNYIQTTFM